MDLKAGLNVLEKIESCPFQDSNPAPSIASTQTICVRVITTYCPMSTQIAIITHFVVNHSGI